MKLSEFILLDEGQKKSVVMHDGILVAKRKNEQFVIFLFQMETYYVETYCDSVNKQVNEFRIFDNTKNLHPYLEAIVIDDLLQ